MSGFELCQPFPLLGDQPQAVEQLLKGLQKGRKHQVLLGVTGSGKTFTIANVIAKFQRPTLVIAPNKTLAAQLFFEFRQLFPHNAVEFFISYYDYYQPEAYVPHTDTYIRKEATINETIDRLRHRATRALLERQDVIVVASVSCIYNLGSPEIYQDLCILLEQGQPLEREELLEKLVALHYRRNDAQLLHKTFRVRGEIVDIAPAYADEYALRVEFWGDEIHSLQRIHPLSGKTLQSLTKAAIYPSSHFAIPAVQLEQALSAIEKELEEYHHQLLQEGKLVEAQRILERTRYDLEMLRLTGICPGVENYSRHLLGKKQGEPPHTLLDYFPKQSLFVIDESHIAIPQLQGMYRGDRSRKETLVRYGFRLPSALDNRPLRFDEFLERLPQAIYVSATPAEFEIQLSQNHIVEQIVRPTGLLDPEIEVRPAQHQVADLLGEIQRHIAKKQRVLITTLTKRMAEDLTDYLLDQGIQAKYMHSDIDALERSEILRNLRKGRFDVLVGINLLREGLDIPEVALVAILDADKEGFLRSTTALIQTCGRAARNLDGKVILYANTITKSIKTAIEETQRRRNIQQQYNQQHQITPRSVQKNIPQTLLAIYQMDYHQDVSLEEQKELSQDPKRIKQKIRQLRQAMQQASQELRFEEAARLRDEIFLLEEKLHPLP